MKRFGKILAIVGFLLIALVVAGVAVLMTIDFNEFKPEIQPEAKKATGRNLVIEGDLKLNLFTLSPGLAVNGVKFQNAKWGSRPDMAKIKRFEAVVSIVPLLSGAVEVRRIILEGADILIEKNKAGKGNYEFDVKGGAGKGAKSKAPAKDQPAEKSGGDLNLVVQAVTVKDAKLVYKDHKAPAPLVVAIDDFTIKGKGKSDPLGIALKGAYNKAKFSADGVLGSPAEMLKPTKPWPIDLTMAAGGATIKIKGHIANPQKASGINIALSVSGKDLSEMSELAQGPVPALGPYNVAAKIAGDIAKSISLSGIKATVGGSTLEGKLNVVLPGKPRVAGGFRSDKLDLADFVKPAAGDSKPASSGGAAKSGGGSAAKGQYVIPDTPLPLAGLKAADADLEFDIKELIATPTKVENIKVTLRLNNGDLKVTPVSMNLAGGTVKAGLRLNASGSVAALTTNMSVDKMSLSQLAAQLGQKDVMDGDVSVAMNMAGNGNSPRKIASGLNGKFDFTMGKGRIKTDTMEEMMGGFMTAITKLIAGNKPIYTVINCGVKRLEIKNGLSTSKAMEFDTDWIALIGGGTVNLKNEQINYGVNPDIKIGGRSTKAPVKIVGTLANPDYTVDALALAGQVGGKLLKGAAGGVLGLVGAGGGSSSGPASNAGCVKVAKTESKPASKSPVDAVKDIIKKPDPKKILEKPKEILKKPGDAIKGLFGR